ncbi:zinc finger protein, putative [Ixodes scapularis]|uniref:Zinc finger protein, putative n=1 Tax=Ixodes scapularis TaxID=6945 RepID=B7PTC6_IXOSC|nr:zinc finger protein, putative [Ixodes scapularis]|eukprot:XP_002404161.1 zinc finger protein, putative [Ixodes scapularis]
MLIMPTEHFDGQAIQGNTTCPVIAREDKFGCCFCSFTTSDPRKLVEHLTDLACRLFEGFECHPCSRTFPDRIDMAGSKLPIGLIVPTEHFDGQATQGNTTCPVIAGEDKFGCCFCILTTANPRKLVGHLTDLACQPFERFECQPCSKTFPNRCAFTRHQRMHAEGRPFKCPHCTAVFRFNHDLAVHKVKHAGEKPCKCTICPKVFARSSDLADHLQAHTDEKPYGCLDCPEASKNHTNLCQHLRTRTRKKLYGGHLCPVSRTKPCHLIVYGRTGTGENHTSAQSV